MHAQDPARYQRFANLEAFTANFIANQSGQRLINQNGVIVIPVVVHVLHRGEAVGTGRNISLAQIQSQIDVLNEDFRRLNADAANTPAPFAPVAADYGFEFRLACQDPDRNPTDGIIRRQTNRNNFQFVEGPNRLPDENAIGIKMTGTGGSDPWPTNHYLNIWVTDDLLGVYGYATWPADFAARPQFDGIVVRTTAFGRVGNVTAPYDLGRVASHEVGHWLNLRHIWGDAVCGDDFVDDTPPQSGPTPTTSTSTCPSFPIATSCAGVNPNGRMFMNYMDVTINQCMNLFTNGQRLRGRAIFAAGGPRAAFIDNYFQIQQPANPVRCRETVRLFNPTCTGPVSWSVLSGPATIAGGQGTNEAIIQSTGSGAVVLQATAGNYITEATIDVNQTAAPISANTSQINCTELVISVSSFLFNSYLWSVQSGDILLNATSTSATTSLPNISATGTYGTISVTATNTCGSTATTLTDYQQEFPPALHTIENYIPYPEPTCYQAEGFYFFKVNDFGTPPPEYQWGYRLNGGSDVIVSGNSYIGQYLFPSAGNYEIFVRPKNECVTGNGNDVTKQIFVQNDCMGGWMCSQAADSSVYSVYPNPASDRITVSVKNALAVKGAKAAESDIKAITVFDKHGAARKRFAYPAKTKNVVVDVSSLPGDIYMLEIQSGNKRYRKMISIHK